MPINVLFLCTGNSARSIMAEVIMNNKGNSNFTAYSAGSRPTGRIHPLALRQIESAKMRTQGLRSKSWDEYTSPGAPEIHFVFTLCDRAVGEECPLLKGHPLTAHWGVPDPAAVVGTPEEMDRAFREAYSILHRRITLFMSLPITKLEQQVIQAEINRIGKQ